MSWRGKEREGRSRTEGGVTEREPEGVKRGGGCLLERRLAQGVAARLLCEEGGPGRGSGVSASTSTVTPRASGAVEGTAPTEERGEREEEKRGQEGERERASSSGAAGEVKGGKEREREKE